MEWLQKKEDLSRMQRKSYQLLDLKGYRKGSEGVWKNRVLRNTEPHTRKKNTSGRI